MAEPHTTHIRIGQVAERTELSIKTLRHYDELGLVTPSARTAGGFRLYTEQDVARLLVIRRMKPLGFTLTEMAELLSALNAVESASGSSESARAVLQQFHTRAEQSCSALRRQVEYAEELTELLSRVAATTTTP